jgi:CBS domain-containing protein
MPIGEICNREVIFATRANTITEAAELMRRHHVGDLVVVEEKSGQRVPVGMLTDRDLVIEILAKNVTLGDVTVGDIMSVDLVAARETDGVYETIQLMRAKGIRRLPVVNPRGGLEGIVSVDDLLELLAEEISGLARLVSREQQREKKTRP